MGRTQTRGSRRRPRPRSLAGLLRQAWLDHQSQQGWAPAVEALSPPARPRCGQAGGKEAAGGWAAGAGAQSHLAPRLSPWQKPASSAPQPAPSLLLCLLLPLSLAFEAIRCLLRPPPTPLPVAESVSVQGPSPLVSWGRIVGTLGSSSPDSRSAGWAPTFPGGVRASSLGHCTSLEQSPG